MEAQDEAQKYISVLRPLESFLPWTPYGLFESFRSMKVDGQQVLYQSTIEAIAKGASHPVKVIIGTVSEEAYLFIFFAIQRELSRLEYDVAITGLFLHQFWNVLTMYPAGSGDQRPLLSVLGNDFIFAAPSRNVAFNLANKEDVYLYQFDHAPSFPYWGPNVSFCQGHSCHAADLPFVFV